jgi:hypothetical protein
MYQFFDQFTNPESGFKEAQTGLHERSTGMGAATAAKEMLNSTCTVTANSAIPSETH